MPPIYTPNANRYNENMTAIAHTSGEDSIVTDSPLPAVDCNNDITVIDYEIITLGIFILEVIQITLVVWVAVKLKNRITF